MISTIRMLTLSVLAASVALGCLHNNESRESNPGERPIADAPRPVAAEESPKGDEPPPLHEIDEEALGKALDRAIEAAVAAEGDTPCERSYNAMVAMRDSLVADLGEAAAQDLPSKSRFIEACEMLPEEAQQCMDVAYAMENAEECQRIMDEVPPEKRRPLEEVLQEP